MFEQNDEFLEKIAKMYEETEDCWLIRSLNKNKATYKKKLAQLITKENVMTFQMFYENILNRMN